MNHRNGQARRRVAVITGSRAEYGLLKTAMSAISRHPRLELQTIVTGTHLLRKFGSTTRDIAADGWRIDAKVPMQRGADDPLDQAIGLSRGIAGIAKALHALRTDVVLVLGDRIEAMAGALAAVTTGRFLAHIHGGDVATGDFDDSLRHSLTKLAHLHLTATPSASRRIIQMGEDEARVQWVGAPGLDRLRALKDDSRQTSLCPPLAGMKVSASLLTKERIYASSLTKGGLRGVNPGPWPTALIMQHPVGRDPSVERGVMENILAEVEHAKLSALCISPNSDRGHSGIIEALEAHAARVPADRFRAVRSLHRDEFLRALIDADVLIGNSSCGVIEAPAAGTPAVNIGTRQNGRERGGDCVIDSDESQSAIRSALARARQLRPITPAYDVYGDGRAGEGIAAHLAKMPLTEAFRRKTFADLAEHAASLMPV